MSSSVEIIPSFSGIIFSKFCPLDSFSLLEEVSQTKAATSLLDSHPFWSVSGVFSFSVSCCFEHYKLLSVYWGCPNSAPLPTKTNFDYENLSNFHPISNLPFLPKILKRVVASQLISHLTETNLFEPLQSVFRKVHSTETALVKVTNDLLIASDSGRLSILILLDFSAAFDTVDHSVLITRLETVFGVSVNWFMSYLNDRKQLVAMVLGLRLMLYNLASLRDQSWALCFLTYIFFHLARF